MRFQSLILAASAAPAVLGCAIPKTRTVVVEAQLYPVATQAPSGPDVVYPVPAANETPSLPEPLVSVKPYATPSKAAAPKPTTQGSSAPASAKEPAAPVKGPAAPVKEPAAPVKEPAASPATGGTSAAVKGKSTFYGGNVSGGTCSFTGYTIPAGLYGTAFSGQVWNSAANCGGCVKVTGPNGNSVTAMIVDQCPECDEGHLDLFQNAFVKLGTLSAGIISTSYEFVDCGISSPIVLKNKSGTSPYWFSMQVVNASERVAKLEVSTNSGSTWQSTQRKDYNFFEQPSGFGTSSVEVRVTSVSGKVVVVRNVQVASDAHATASSNF
ncbi:hypothetical protein ACHAQH_000613 [Verticillium albo-atrum]